LATLKHLILSLAAPLWLFIPPKNALEASLILISFVPPEK
jgi:hypothetical protein